MTPLARGRSVGAELVGEINRYITNAWNVCGEWMGEGCKARTLFSRTGEESRGGKCEGTI